VSTVARRVVISGRVQGVFFREQTRRRADAAGVSGWVRNNEDGTVEAWFEGDEQDVAVLVDFARRGPSSAEVDDVEVEEVQPAGAQGFEVR
jgi:acylphosphatase